MLFLPNPYSYLCNLPQSISIPVFLWSLSHLFFFFLHSLCPLQPPTLFPTFPPPGWLCCRGFRIVSNTADRSTSLTPGCLANKTACHSWTTTTITVCYAKASSRYGPTGQVKEGKKKTTKKRRGRKTERGGLQDCMPSLERGLDHGCLWGNWMLAYTHTQHVGTQAAHRESERVHA